MPKYNVDFLLSLVDFFSLGFLCRELDPTPAINRIPRYVTMLKKNVKSGKDFIYLFTAAMSRTKNFVYFV